MNLTVTRFGKSIACLSVGFAAACLAFAFNRPLHETGTIRDGIVPACALVAVWGLCLTGFAVYAWREYIKDHREHAPDMLFCLAAGLLCLAVGLLAFLMFGGISTDITEQWYTAANVCIVLTTALPLPFLFRALVIAVKMKDDVPRGRRRVILCIVWGMLIGYAALAVFGGMLDFPYAQYDEDGYLIAA